LPRALARIAILKTQTLSSQKKSAFRVNKMSSFSSENNNNNAMMMRDNNKNGSSRDHSFDDDGKEKKKHNKISNKKRFFTIVLVASDCLLIGLQPILVHLTKNSRGGFAYHPVSVNFITEATKVLFAVVFLMVQVRCWREISRARGVSLSRLLKHLLCLRSCRRLQSRFVHPKLTHVSLSFLSLIK
jgi:hypothetical protein